jgi:hippurate hydrolase
MVTALQTLVTRKVDIDDPVVLTVGRFAAGTKENIIPDEAVFEATIRSFSPANRVLLEKAVRRLLEGIADAHDLRAEIEWTPGYPPTVNDVDEYAFARATLVDLFGEDRYDEEASADPGTEDFSYVLERVPGAYVSISACAAGDPVGAPDNHSARAVFDDSVLPDCAAYLAEVAVRRLARNR